MADGEIRIDARLSMEGIEKALAKAQKDVVRYAKAWRNVSDIVSQFEEQVRRLSSSGGDYAEEIKQVEKNLIKAAANATLCAVRDCSLNKTRRELKEDFPNGI